MSQAAPEVAPASDPAESSTAVTTPPTPDAPAASSPAPKTTNLWDDPQAAKAEIEKLRRENAAARTNAKNQAAEDARAELAQTIGKAIGIVQEDPIDPAKLTEQVSASQADARKARVELAVYRNAATAGGDPVALLDSASFLESLAGLDPSDPAAVAAAITSAVEANPRLGAATQVRTPAPNPAQGSANGSGAPSQLSEAEVKRLYSERKYAEIEKAKNEGRLNAYLGIS